MSLPKPVSEKTLNREYRLLTEITCGRLDISTEKGEALSSLIHHYFSACANLYGIISLKTMWKIFKELTFTKPNELLQKDFFALSEILRVENLPYYILDLNELYDDAPPPKPQNRLLVNKKLIDRLDYFHYEDCYTLIDAQNDKPYILLKKEDYLAWSDPEFFRKTPCANQMLHFLETLRVSNDSKKLDIQGRPIQGKNLSHFIFWNDDDLQRYRNSGQKWKKDILEARNNVTASEKLMRGLERFIQLGDINISFSRYLEIFLKDLENLDVNLTQKQMDVFMTLFTNFNNKSRLWCNCGWTPDELINQNNTPNHASSISFGSGLQKAFQNGDIDENELRQFILKNGFRISE